MRELVLENLPVSLGKLPCRKCSVHSLTFCASSLAEIVPVKHRGYSLAILTAFVLPFAPYVMYCELFATRGANPTWRWGMWISLIYNGITLVGLAVFYWPHGTRRADGLRKIEVLKRIDYVGAVLSIVGLTLL